MKKKQQLQTVKKLSLNKLQLMKIGSMRMISGGNSVIDNQNDDPGGPIVKNTLSTK